MNLKQKIQKLLNQKERGSVLIYSIIILGMMLAIVIGMTSVSISDLKSSNTTGNSTQAFQTANSGSELLLKAMKTATKVNNLAVTGFTCDNGTKNLEGSIGNGTSSIVLYDDTDTKINCNVGVDISSIAKIKSTGTFGGSSRAIEVAIAAPVTPGVTGGCMVLSTGYIRGTWGTGCKADGLPTGAICDSSSGNGVALAGYSCGATSIKADSSIIYCSCVKS